MTDRPKTCLLQSTFNVTEKSQEFFSFDITISKCLLSYVFFSSMTFFSHKSTSCIRQGKLWKGQINGIKSVNLVFTPPSLVSTFIIYIENNISEETNYSESNPSWKVFSEHFEKWNRKKWDIKFFSFSQFQLETLPV